MSPKQLKGIVVKIQGKYIKFKKNSVIYDKQNNLIQGELLEFTKLATASGNNLFFRGIVKFDLNQKVIKGFLSKPQKITAKNKKIILKGFVQFTPEGVLKRESSTSPKLEEHFDKNLVALIEDEIFQAETIEYFTLAHHQYIIKPRPKISLGKIKKVTKHLSSKY